MIVRCIRNTNDQIDFFIYVEDTSFRVLKITDIFSTDSFAHDCLVDDKITDIACTYSTPSGSTIMILCSSKILICKISYDGIPGNCKEVVNSNYSGKWNSILWVAKTGIFLLCNGNGIYTASEDASTSGIIIDKLKMSVVSEIGPQSKFFVHKGNFTILALWTCASQTNTLIVSANPVTEVKVVSWAVADCIANTMTLLWSLSMGSSHVVEATRASYDHSANALQWTAIYCANVLWLLGLSGVLAKVSLQEHPTVTGLLILKEEQRLDSVVTAEILLSCVNGTFLYVVMELGVSTCRLLEIRQVIFCTVGWDQKVGGSAVLIPCCQELCVVPTEFWEVHGTPTSATGPAPLVLIGTHECFGMHLLIEADVSSDSRDEWVAHDFLRRLAAMTNTLAGMKDAIWLSAEGGLGESTSLLALHTNVQSRQSAIYKLQTESYCAQRCWSAHISLEGGDHLHINAAAVTKVGTLLPLSSRITRQTAIYNCINKNTASGAEQLLALYAGHYVQEEYTIALFTVNDCTIMQITSVGVHLLCPDKPPQSATVLQLCTESSTGNGMRRSCYNTDGTECPPRTSSSGAAISQAEQVGVGLFALRIGGEVLIVSAGTSDGHDCTMKVTQIFQFVSESCGISSSSGITPTTHEKALLVVCCWDGSLALFRMSSSCDCTLNLTQVVRNPADQCLETPIRHLCVVHIYQSSDIIVHALVCVSTHTKVTVLQALYNVQQRATQVSIAHCLSMSGGVESLTKLDVKDSGAGRATVCVFVRGLRTDYLLGCDIALLDGCARQVPLLEWHSRQLVTPAGRCRPALYFSLPRDRDIDASFPQSRGLNIGWMESSKASNESDIIHARICFGWIDLSKAPFTSIADRAFVSGLVVSMKLTPDHLKIIVLLENAAPAVSGGVEHVGGNRVVQFGRVIVYDFTSFEMLWQQDVCSSPHKNDLGYLVAALPGPIPVSPHPAGVANLTSMMLSVVHCMPSVHHLATTSVAVASKLTFTSFSLRHQRVDNGDVMYETLPAGRVVLSAEPCGSGHPFRSGLQQSESDHMVEPLPSSTFHVHALSENLLLVCMHDNVLRLVGWKEQSGSLGLAELSTTNLENKGTVVVEIQVVAARRVIVSLALCGLEIHSLQRDGTRNANSVNLQFTHFISQDTAIWTSVSAREHRHANEDAELSIALTERLSARHQIAVVEIPSSASTLTGAVLKCVLGTLTLPEGLQSSGVFQLIPAPPSSGMDSKLLRRNSQIVSYSIADISIAR